MASAKCRVCHRVLTNPAHIAAGVGPICAQRAARRASVTDRAPAYPAAKLERINRNVVRLGAMLQRRDDWTDEAYSLIVHWYGRWRMMQLAVAKRQQYQQMAAWAR